MSDALPDEQVAAARDGALPDAAAPTASQRRKRVRTLDFTRPSKFTTDQQRRLERAHETFCRTASTRLSAQLRVSVSLELVDTAQVTWTSALEELPESSITAIVDVEPHGGRMLLCVELSLVLSLIECLLGGGAEGEPEGGIASRHLTDVDLALTRRILQTLLDELSISVGELSEGLRFGLSDLETERAPSGIAPLSEPTMALTLAARLGGMSAPFMVLIPHRAIEPVLIASDPAVAEVEVDAATAVGEALGAVQVQLRAEVGSIDLPLDEVLALRAGDIVRLAEGAGAGGVTLFADQVALHRARLGRNGRRRAIQIIEPMEESA